MSINSYLVKEILKSVKIEVEDLDERFDYSYSRDFRLTLVQISNLESTLNLNKVEKFNILIEEFKSLVQEFKSFMMLCDDEYCEEWIKYGLFSADIIISKLDYIASLYSEVKL